MAAVAMRALGVARCRRLTFRAAVVALFFDAATTVCVRALWMIFGGHLSPVPGRGFGGARPFRREHVRLLLRGCETA